MEALLVIHCFFWRQTCSDVAIWLVPVSHMIHSSLMMQFPVQPALIQMIASSAYSSFVICPPLNTYTCTNTHTLTHKYIHLLISLCGHPSDLAHSLPQTYTYPLSLKRTTSLAAFHVMWEAFIVQTQTPCRGQYLFSLYFYALPVH